MALPMPLHPGLKRIAVSSVMALMLTVLNASAVVQPSPTEAVVNAVAEATCGKRIVLLGELPSHGEARGFEIKAGIVDRLVARCGFTAVLFEAPIYDFLGVEQAIDRREATQGHLDNAVGRFWLTRELAPWRRTLFAAAAEGRISIGGIDDQISITSAYARATLPELVAANSPTAAASACRAIVHRHVNWTYDTGTPFDEAEQARLDQCAREASKRAAITPGANAPERVMLESFARYAQRQRAGQSTTRDQSMFTNLAWYIDRLPATSRVVVWTATVHAAKIRGSRTEAPLGAFAAERWGDRVASVGFTARSGFTSRAGQAPTPLAATPADSLEAIATGESTMTVLDGPALQRLGAIPSRLFGRIATETWSNYFDFVVAIREEVAPTFDPWK